MVGGLVVADALPEGPLRVRVDVHLDRAGLDGVLDVLRGGAGTAMENKINGLLVVAAQLLGDVLLRVVEDLGLQADVARRVDAVHVAEGRGHGELAVGDLGQGLVDLPDLLGLRVELGRVDVGVVDAVLLAAGDAQLHLQEQVGLGHARQVLDAGRDVLLEGVLGQIEHVRGEQRLAVLGEVVLVGVQQPVEPGQPVAHAVVRVEDDRHAVELRELAHLERARHAPGDGGLVGHAVLARDELAGQELAAAARELHDHGAAELRGRLQTGVDAAARHGVDGGDREAALLGVR